MRLLLRLLILVLPIEGRYVGEHPNQMVGLPAIQQRPRNEVQSPASNSPMIASRVNVPVTVDAGVSHPREGSFAVSKRALWPLANGCGNLKGVVFNGGMQPTMYDKMTTATAWFTFQLTIPSSGGASARTTRDHIPMMAFARDVAAAVNLVNGPNPPAWLLTFNEPDYSYMGWTPTMTPQQAADAIKPLLARPGSRTKYVAPVLAFTDSGWLDQFFAACNCRKFFSAYNIHQYHPTAQEVITNVKNFHNRYSDKPLWITEVAPGQAGCKVSWDAAGQFMRELYRFAKGSGWVERVFWNTGNQLTNGDQNVCNSWLVDPNGNPGPLLKTFEAMNCT